MKNRYIIGIDTSTTNSKSVITSIHCITDENGNMITKVNQIRCEDGQSTAKETSKIESEAELLGATLLKG